MEEYFFFFFEELFNEILRGPQQDIDPQKKNVQKNKIKFPKWHQVIAVRRKQINHELILVYTFNIIYIIKLNFLK